MGDPKKELGEDDFDKFDAKKSEAMGVFSEGNIFFYRNIGEHITDTYISETDTTELENLRSNIIDIFIIET